MGRHPDRQPRQHRHQFDGPAGDDLRSCGNWRRVGRDQGHCQTGHLCRQSREIFTHILNWEPPVIMKIPFVDLHAQYLTLKPEIDAAIQDVIANSAYIRGPHVEKFEKLWAETLGVKHCISCANGTDALYITMRGLGLKPGDEVITTAHSWIATTETITQAGGKVVFTDTEYDTFNLAASQIEAKITPRTVGIIPVHLYGQPSDMDAIMAIARKH